MWKSKITIKAAAEILGVSPQTLRNWERQGIIKTKRDPGSGFRVYNVTELELFAKGKLKQKRAKRKLSTE